MSSWGPGHSLESSTLLIRELVFSLMNWTAINKQPDLCSKLVFSSMIWTAIKGEPRGFSKGSKWLVSNLITQNVYRSLHYVGEDPKLFLHEVCSQEEENFFECDYEQMIISTDEVKGTMYFWCYFYLTLLTLQSPDSCTIIHQFLLIQNKVALLVLVGNY